MLDALLIEIEGVLADTAAARRAAFVRSAHDDGLPLDARDYDELCDGLAPHDAARAAVAALGARRDETALDLLVLRAERYFGAEAARGLVLVPGARELVESLAGRVRMAVVTRASRRHAGMILALADLESAFECVITAEDVRRPRPAPDGHEHALERLGRRRPVRRERCAALEGTIAGIRAARAAGIRCIAAGALPAWRALDADACLPALEGVTPDELLALAAPAAEPRR